MRIFQLKINNSALSLTELLVASILIGIVMVGVISFSYTVKSLQDATNKAGLLATRTAAVISQVSRDAALATGYQSDPGIVLGDSSTTFASPNTSGATWIAFREDTNTPETFTDDQWVIYFVSGSNLYSCTHTAAEGPSPNSDPANKCNTGTTNPRIISQDIKTATFNFVVSTDATAGLAFYIDVQLTTCFDPSTCNTASPDYIKSPVQTISTRISPSSHSW